MAIRRARRDHADPACEGAQPRRRQMKTLLDRLFGIAEEINGGHRCATYMYRSTLLSTRWGKIYLHKFVGDDWSRDLHDHPKRFVSIGLWGRYWESSDSIVGDRDPLPDRLWKAPWVRRFPPSIDIASFWMTIASRAGRSFGSARQSANGGSGPKTDGCTGATTRAAKVASRTK
jgi:hypothetical protein